MTKLWPYEVSAKKWELKQRRDIENQRRDIENQRRDIAESAETEHLDAATLPNDVVAFGVGFGLIFSPF